MINVLEKMGKELVVALFEVLSQHLHAGTTEGNKKNIEP
jgi:hypothetical protein